MSLSLSTDRSPRLRFGSLNCKTSQLVPSAERSHLVQVRGISVESDSYRKAIASDIVGLTASLGKQDKTWVGEVWVNPAMEGEELLNGLLIWVGAVVVDESEWVSCPNQRSLQAAEELAGLE
ncbi:hypothetical protein [Laspinema olomoucense]|uniref:Uncharacterized protein n=1 Tax=Laspinema olomoucense D3b TaxID=2953688 RepID=A0ABT2N4M9_9CYAN|nr:hypothetical protein [Laspinema sp. D3b]MCT7977607.1 hypothetical protein [Laspinema sp. D3b]